MQLFRESVETSSFRKDFLSNNMEFQTFSAETWAPYINVSGQNPRGQHSIPEGSSEQGIPGGCDLEEWLKYAAQRLILHGSGKTHVSESFRTFFPASRISHQKGRVRGKMSHVQYFQFSSRALVLASLGLLTQTPACHHLPSPSPM